MAFPALGAAVGAAISALPGLLLGLLSVKNLLDNAQSAQAKLLAHLNTTVAKGLQAQGSATVATIDINGEEVSYLYGGNAPILSNIETVLADLTYFEDFSGHEPRIWTLPEILLHTGSNIGTILSDGIYFTDSENKLWTLPEIMKNGSGGSADLTEVVEILNEIASYMISLGDEEDLSIADSIRRCSDSLTSLVAENRETIEVVVARGA